MEVLQHHATNMTDKVSGATLGLYMILIGSKYTETFATRWTTPCNRISFIVTLHHVIGKVDGILLFLANNSLAGGTAVRTLILQEVGTMLGVVLQPRMGYSEVFSQLFLRFINCIADMTRE